RKAGNGFLADELLRAILGRGIQFRVEGDRRPVEELESLDVRIEPARDAADGERTRDEREIETPRRYVREQSRPGPHRVLQAEAAANDRAVEHARDEIAVHGQHAIAIGEPGDVAGELAGEL